MTPKTVRVVALLVLGLCAAPMAATFLAFAIAKANGCTLHEGFANPCIVLGVDIGNTLYSMGVMFWFTFLTMPIAALMAVAWLVAEAVFWWRGRGA